MPTTCHIAFCVLLHVVNAQVTPDPFPNTPNRPPPFSTVRPINNQRDFDPSYNTNNDPFGNRGVGGGRNDLFDRDRDRDFNRDQDRDRDRDRDRDFGLDDRYGYNRPFDQDNRNEYGYSSIIREASYFVVASRMVRPGQLYRVAVTILKEKAPLTVRASIQRNGVEMSADHKDVKVGIPETLLMRVSQ